MPRRWAPAAPPGLRLVPESETATDNRELTESPDFGDVTVTGHPQEIT
ncbi:hypothetical protein [Streptomyces sp. NPDC001508]